MINQTVIKKFLRRQLNEYDWLKLESPERIDQSIAELKPAPHLSKLWLHQKVCFLLIEALKRFMLHIDMGGGKTLITLSILRYRKQRGETPKAIVFVPYITSVETWIEETAKHAPELVCVPLTGTTNQNFDSILNSKGDLFVICYQSAVTMLAEPVKKVGKRKKKWTIRSEFVRETFQSFDMLVMDEIHRCKSPSALTYRMCRAISSITDYVIGLTGTPFGRDLSDLWPQFYLVDFGETLGPTFGFYREVFFNQEVNYFGAYEYNFKKKLFGTLQTLIKNISIRYSVDEFYDMPPLEFIPKIIKPHLGIKAYADKHLEEIKRVLAKGDGAYRAIESEYLKLRQLSSGFMTLKGEDTTKIQFKFDENPKLDLLQELIEDMPYGCKMVIFHHFVYTNVLISERLKAMKVGHARIYGKQKDPIAELQRFKRDDNCRALVINSKSGSSSLNLQIANYLVFFEQPDSAIDRQQAERRCWRPGQERRVMIYDFLMKGTADTAAHKANKEGKNLLEALLDGKDAIGQ